MNRTVLVNVGSRPKHELVPICQVTIGCTEGQPPRAAQSITSGTKSDEVLCGGSDVNDDIEPVHAAPAIETIVSNPIDLLVDAIAFFRQLLFNGYRLRGLVGTRCENEYKRELGYDYSI